MNERACLLGVICLIYCGLFNLQPAWAGEGNIDATYKYALSENSGWQNFRPDNGGVTVNDTCLSGYAWAENIGWVKLDSGTGPYDNTTSAWAAGAGQYTGPYMAKIKQGKVLFLRRLD